MTTDQPPTIKEGTVFYLTILTDEHIRDLNATAAELRSARHAHPTKPRLGALRLHLGALLVAAGTALVSGARPAPRQGALQG